MSLIDDFGSIYLVSRMERLSDMLKKDAIRVLKVYLPDIKYKWYPVIYALQKKKTLSVVELAGELSYVHPTIIDILNEMEEKNMIKSTSDKKDNRKRLLSLTSKGNKMYVRLLPLISAFTIAVNDLIENDNHLLKALAEVEDRLEDEPFFQRVNKQLKSKHSIV